MCNGVRKLAPDNAPSARESDLTDTALSAGESPGKWARFEPDVAYAIEGLWPHRSAHRANWRGRLPTGRAMSFRNRASIGSLNADDLMTSPAFVVRSAGNTFQHPTRRPNERWQTDCTYLHIVGWGWYSLSTVLDDDSRDILRGGSTRRCRRPTSWSHWTWPGRRRALTTCPLVVPNDPDALAAGIRRVLDDGVRRSLLLRLVAACRVPRSTASEDCEPIVISARVLSIIRLY